MDPRFLKTSGREAYTGNELILKGALEAGVNLITGYPGSPVADVFDAAGKIAPYLKERGILAEIANNEALAAARLNGSQMVDLRAMAVMKSVGYNVAADGLFTGNLAKTGHRGGAVVVVGDDPWNDSTQVPQDSRWLSNHLMLPVLEPATYQEVKDFTRDAFELSARANLYVSVIVSTNLADGGAEVDVGRHPEGRISTLKPTSIDTRGIDTTHSILLPPNTSALEKEAYLVKFPAALEAAGELKLNRLELGLPGVRLGFATAGLPYAYLCEMLRGAGMEGRFPILKLGMPYPLEPAIVRQFAGLVDEIIVIENKRSFLEMNLRDKLMRAFQKGEIPTLPLVWGKEFPEGFPGMPAEHGMNPSVILKRLGPFLKARGLSTPALVKELELVQRADSVVIKRLPKRTPTFCSGCPHRDSTSVFLDLIKDLKDPEYMRREHGRGPLDLLFHGDAGCYSLLFLPPNGQLMHNYSGMGLGGGTAAGLDPFVTNKAVTFIGDGTFFHSGMAAASDSLKNNADILYVVLDNKTTAMTGHQPNPGVAEDLMGQPTFAQDAETALKGLTRGTGAPIVRVDPELREGYREALEELILKDGPKFLIADKECGITFHRRRRRDQAKLIARDGFLETEVRIGVDQEVCEYCLECTNKTGCPGLNVVETPHGPKIATDESTCVSDGACARVKACPSFEEVTIHRRAAAATPSLPDPSGLSAPSPHAFGEAWRAYLAGIGGMGIGSGTALLVRAGQKQGYHVSFCDKKGMAIRNGGVYSHVTFTKEPKVLSPVIPYGKADLLIGLDLLEAARGVDPAMNLRVASPEHTACVVNSTKNQTILSLMGKEGFSTADLEAALKANTRQEEYWSAEVSKVSQRWLGNTLYDNTMMLGVAFQRGLLPLSLAAFEAAFQETFKGAALEKNMQAFHLGRDLVVHPERYGTEQEQRLSGLLNEKAAILRRRAGRRAARAYLADLEQAFLKLGLPEDEQKHLALRYYELIRYEDLDYARGYLKRVQDLHVRDNASQGYAATRLALRSLYKVMAIKDEVWVAGLLTSDEKRVRDARRYNIDATRGDRLEYRHFNRPHFDVLGLKFEFDLKSRPWMLKLMARAKFLRRLLPDWHSREKEFRDWFLELAARFEPRNAGDYQRWLQVLSLPSEVTGYRDVRYPKMDQARTRAVELLSGRHGGQGSGVGVGVAA